MDSVKLESKRISVKANNLALFLIHFALCILYFLLWLLIPTFFPSLAFVRDVMFAVLLPHLLAGFLVIKGSNGGKILSRVLGVLLLFGIPVGTVLGVTIFVLTSKKRYVKI